VVDNADYPPRRAGPVSGGCRRLAVRRGRPRWWAVPAGKEFECFGSRLRDVQGSWLG